MAPPHATLEVRGTKVYQCKGKSNKAPIRKYVPAIKHFIESQHLEFVHDYQKLGLLKQDGKLYDVFDLPKDFVVKGDLNLRGMDLTELPDLSTITVNENFNCGHNQLTSLAGAPKSASRYIFGELEKPYKIMAREYLHGKNTDIPPEILEIMIANYKKHLANTLKHETELIDESDEKSIILRNDTQRSV